MQYPAATWIDVMVHAILSVLRSAASPEVRKIWIYAQGDKETFLNLRLGDRVGDKGGDTKKDEEWSLLCERLAESVASTLSVSTDRSLLRRSFPSERPTHWAAAIRTTKGVVALAGLPKHWNEALLLHAAMAAGVALPEDRPARCDRERGPASHPEPDRYMAGPGTVDGAGSTFLNFAPRMPSRRLRLRDSGRLAVTKEKPIWKEPIFILYSIVRVDTNTLL